MADEPTPTKPRMTLEDANKLTFRKVDYAADEALEAKAKRLWKTVASMESARTFTPEVLTSEISV